MTTQSPRILLVDDEASIQRSVGALLRARGYDVDIAGTGSQAIERFEQRTPALIVLDLGLPDIEGTEVCRRIRETSRVPIIVLSARGAEADKVHALDLGGDDYVTKPFGPEELLARVRVALRRATTDTSAESGLLRAGALIIDYDRRRVVRDDVEIRLTPKEFELLTLLAHHHDRVLTHRTILKQVWGPNAVEQPEHLWTLVAQLRKKIEPDPSEPIYVISEPWVGYRFVTGLKKPPTASHQLDANAVTPETHRRARTSRPRCLLPRTPSLYHLKWSCGSPAAASSRSSAILQGLLSPSSGRPP